MGLVGNLGTGPEDDAGWRVEASVNAISANRAQIGLYGNPMQPTKLEINISQVKELIDPSETQGSSLKRDAQLADNFDIDAATGLSENEAAELLKDAGYNELPSAKPRSFFTIAFEVAKEPMFLLLVPGA